MTNIVDQTGYDQEARYFHESEQEKIKTIRSVREATKKALQKEIHWMKCPKCGEQMEEKEFQGIMIDKCTSCSGIYFDQGELEILLKHKEPQGFLNKLTSIFN